MNKSLITTCSITLLLAAGCSSNQNKNRITFNTDVENPYWQPNNSTTLVAEAHSGNYVCKINKDNAYSSTFQIKVKDISRQPLTKATISAWIMLTSDVTEQNLVLEIRDTTNQDVVLEWLNMDAANYIDELNQWVKVEHIIDLTINNRNNLKNIYRVYAANGKNDAVYVDDIAIEFE